MRSFLIAVFVAFPFSLCFPAFEPMDYGARSAAMGGAFCGLSNDCQAISVNPAGLPKIVSPQILAFYSRLHSMAELVYSSISYSQPTRVGTFGLRGSTFGREPYQEFLILLGHGYPIGRISLGGNLRLMRVRISDYGSANSVGVDLGLLGVISAGLNLGMSVQNLNKPKLGEHDIPSSLTCGFVISPAQRLIFCGDVYKEDRHALETRFGAEYCLGSHLALRSGFTTGPCSFFTWGVGCWVGDMELSYGGKTHSALGLTHSFSLLFSFGPRASLEVFRFSDS